jgi:hypothetical protein
MSAVRLVPATVVLLAVTQFGAVTAQRAPRHDIDHVAAFARLYGVARYFYPSDAAAGLDWDAFAIHGVTQARAAVDQRALEATLEALFGPLGPGIEIGRALPPRSSDTRVDSSLVAWRYLGAGMAPWNGAGPYKAKRTNRSPVARANIDGFVTLMQSIPAEPLRGKTIRLRGQVRAAVRGPEGSAALWLRVDRAGSKAGFFDNMRDRPVREAEWREYSIEGMVADDAANVSFGVMASGAVTADFDAIDLAVRDGSGPWTAVPIADAGFEAASFTGWVRAGLSKTAAVSRVAEPAPEGDRFLRFSPPSEQPPSSELFDDAAPMVGAHVDVNLGSGLKARVALALSDEQAREHPGSSSQLQTLRTALRQVERPGGRADLDARLADVVVAWSVFRHFYPYWGDVGVDWDARLRPQLELAAAAHTRREQHDALQQLVADARDGHGSVVDLTRRGERAVLPIRLALIGDDLAVIASSVPADAPVGAVVSAIDGVPAKQRMNDAMRLASGTTQWKQARALQEITSCERGAVVTVSLDGGNGPRQAALSCEALQAPVERRPDLIAEVQPGVWYVDLTRAVMSQVGPALEKLAPARAVVFDMRGYPTDAGARILPHLLGSPEGDRWMHVAKLIGPFGQSTGWESHGWNLKPAHPRLRGSIVFLTDGRAISYAESVMGYVADLKLGTIVGSTTAGTNGNVASFSVPGRFTVAFTGMRVTRHDGRTSHHLAGIKPDVAVTPSLAALRAVRDEVLERALALTRGR